MTVQATHSPNTAIINRQEHHETEEPIHNFNIGVPTKLFTGVLFGASVLAMSNPMSFGVTLAGGSAIAITSKLVSFF
ncbi:hypothetical protein D5018_18345 [Parashewanella curva]|uniref:Uncharacterized protein n=1 Tax=Parashewanella curva TaxID=2338552 RepID=A0A3L8PUZ0_9GAMM|nr:hypothetical protein [Parashewanella curva]RLV58238.1 hypothetical protein D5018_18345 [Parashewanella curva]